MALVDEAQEHLARGDALVASGDHAGAAAAYRHAIALEPAWGAPYLSLADVQIRRGDFEGALTSLADARQSRVGEDSAVLWRRIGLALAGLHRWSAASAALLAAVGREPKMSTTWHTLGCVLRRLGHFERARDALRRAVDLDERAAVPDWIESLVDLGEVGRARAEIAQLGAAMDGPTRAWLTARCAFLSGELSAAWSAYESRHEPAIGLRQRGVQLPAVNAPRWRAESLSGRTIAVVSEQGFGDVIQFARFLTPLADRGARVRLVLDSGMRTLAKLLATAPGLSAIDVAPDVSEVDLQVPLLSLPYHLQTNAIPTKPYLRVPPGAVPPPELGQGTLNVGLVWGGDPNHTNDLLRSTTLERMLDLASVPGARLFSLQLGVRASELRGHEALVTDLSRWIADWGDTASLVSALDLVITVDTAVAHLAGALGRPVWVALPFAPDWRWLLEGQDSAWYPTMRLFRQPVAGDWAPVFARMRDELFGFVRRHLDVALATQ
jgi:thioredoxin-like negative regulator of GroEL